MSNFMDGIKSTLNNECNVSVTENGAVGFRTTGKALLDLNFAVASLRSASEPRHLSALHQGVLRGQADGNEMALLCS